MNNLFKRENLFLLGFFILFICIRSIHFSDHLNFSSDQALFSIKSLELYQNKQITLIGPPISLSSEGRDVFQGSVIYYFLMLFLLSGDFDPIKTSYIFMLFSSIMIFPLYFGTKLLTNKITAFVAITMYTLFPFYIDYTRFIWNPNFQFSLLPILLLFIGLFDKYRKPIYFFIIFLLNGILIQFHYQFIIILIGLIIYYVLINKLPSKFLLLIAFGTILGFSPLIIFELRHNFYNLSAILHAINSSSDQQQTFISSEHIHYILSISFFVIITVLIVSRDYISQKTFLIILTILLITSSIMYFPKPSQGFRMSENWNYPNEEKVFNIIKSRNLSDYNIANLIYDTNASVQKYLHKREGLENRISVYGENKYLFVVHKTIEDYTKNTAYEVNTFKPSAVEKTWQINNIYSLTLLKK